MSDMTLRQWLLTDEPTSRRHARLASFYKGLADLAVKFDGYGRVGDPCCSCSDGGLRAFYCAARSVCSKPVQPTASNRS